MQLPSVDWVTKFILITLATVGLFLGGVTAIAIHNGKVQKATAQYYLEEVEINLPAGLYLTEYGLDDAWLGEGIRYMVYKIQDDKHLAGSDIDPTLFQKKPYTEQEMIVIANAENNIPKLRQYIRNPNYAHYYKESFNNNYPLREDENGEIEYVYDERVVILYSKEEKQYIFIVLRR